MLLAGAAVLDSGGMTALRGVALTAALSGAVGSLACMFHAARHQNSYLLLLLFTVWVLSPFAATIWAHTMARRWSPGRQLALYTLMLALTVGSVAVYAAVALGRAQFKVGFVFLVAPFASWVILAVASVPVFMHRGVPRQAGGK
jgi:hypothetical protein